MKNNGRIKEGDFFSCRKNYTSLFNKRKQYKKPIRYSVYDTIGEYIILMEPYLVSFSLSERNRNGMPSFIEHFSVPKLERKAKLKKLEKQNNLRKI
jgi:hypothetical protein